MEIRLVAYNRLGGRRGVLPYPLEMTFVETKNDESTIQLHYAQTAPNHEYLDDQPELALEVWTGTDWEEPLNARLRYISVDFDHLEETPTRRYDFLGIGEGLKGALVYSDYGLPLNDEGKVRFNDSNAGQILGTVWMNAEARGLTGYSYNFSTTHDSAGQPWTKTFTISYGVDNTLAGILTSLVNNGVVDYAWDGRTLNVYNAGTALATDHTLEPGGVRFVGSGGTSGVDSAPEMTNASGLATHVIVLGEGGLRWEFPTDIPLPEGRREIVLQYSGVDEEATARVMADPIITKAQNILKNTTRQFHITDKTKWLPFLDYTTGDWAYVQRGTMMERMNIQSISITMNDRGVQGYVTLGDRIDDLLSAMYKRIQGLSGGIPNEGTGTPPSDTTLPPSAPTGLSGSSNAYINAEGDVRSGVTLVWEHDGKNTEGRKVDVSYYIVSARLQGATEWRELFRSTTKTGAYSPFVTFDQYGDPEVWEFTVQAVSTNNRVSARSAIEVVTLEEDVVPPPTPSTPTVSTWLRTVTVQWDQKGLTPTGVVTNMPADFDYIKVWQGSAPDMADAVVLGIMRTDSFYAGSQPAGVTKWYALSAVDRTGNESGKSVSVAMTAQNNVDLTEITNVIDGALLGTNSVTYVALQASEQMWVRVLGAHKIKVGELDANSITSDTGFIGALRVSILNADSVTSDMIQGNAITAKHTLTGPLYQTVATLNRGIKIDVNGFRSYDNNGQLMVNITSSSATFTGTVKSGFGSASASITDNAGRGRPGLKLETGGGQYWQPQVLGASGQDGWASGTLMAVSSRNASTANDLYSMLTLGGGGVGWYLGNTNGLGANFQAITAFSDLQTLKLQGGTGVMQMSNGAVYMSANGAVIQAESNNTVTISAGGTTIYGGLNVSGSKNFVMDHPTKPGWQLLHGSTESPVSGVEYWDCTTLDETGQAVVELPDYFEALIKPGSECVGVFGNGSMVSWTGIENNQFTVSGEPGTQFSWQVKAERAGADFDAERVKVEPTLPTLEETTDGSEPAS